MSDALSRRLSRALAVVALLGAGYYWVFGGAYDLRDLRNLEVRVSDRANELAAMRAELDSVRTRADSLISDPWVIERVARERYGFIRPGELLVRFVEMEAARRPSNTTFEE